MRRGCGCAILAVVAVATSPIWVPAFLLGTAYLLAIASWLLSRI